MIRSRRVCSGGGAPKCSRQSAPKAALFISGRELSCSERSISPVAILIYRAISVSDIDALVGRTVKLLTCLYFSTFYAGLVDFSCGAQVGCRRMLRGGT